MKIRKILFWILFILSIIVVIWYIVGDSPTFEQSILVIILTALLKQSDSVNDVKISITNLNNKVNILENRIDKIENKVDKLER